MFLLASLLPALISQSSSVGRRIAVGWSDERGQTSAEYALVLLGAGSVALLIIGWATQTDVVGRLLDTVFGQLIKHVKG